MSKFEFKSVLQDMIDRFTLSSRDLLTITSQDLVEREKEKAVYARVFARPSKRLAKLLSVDREILVLFTYFPDQQARTIRTARDLIDDASGRLETTVAIIVHPDSSGNAKLKKWGREHGISVLPILLLDNQSATDAMDFERLLCRELFSHDPFDVTGPVSDDTQFYGRRTEAQDLARQLQIGQIKSCMGIRKIGKTSVINRVISHSKAYHECYCVMVDCSKDEVWLMRSGQLLDALASATLKALSSDNRYAAVEHSSVNSDVATCSDRLLKVLSQSHHPLIVFFDEVDYITPGSPTASHWKSEFNIFWRNLRAIYQEADRLSKKFSILVSGVSSRWFCVESIDGVENAALAFVPEEYLSPLPRGASLAMIKNMARTSGLLFDESNSDPIARVCSDIPFWIRKACSYIHRQIDIQNRPLRPDDRVVRELLDKFTATEGAILAQVALRHLFRVFPELEGTSRKCLDSKTADCPKYHLTVLERYGVVTSAGGNFRLSGEIMRAGLEMFLDERLRQSDSETAEEQDQDREYLQTSFGAVGEWADELALVGRRRNLLERKLRNIVLNFIRFDCLSNKQKGSVSDRLLKIINEKQRGKLVGLPPEELVEKFLWTDLTNLISKEWVLFERIFSDKNQFSLNSNLINDRPDAHAKRVDSADLAMYRRSLKWFEDCLSAL